MSDDTCPKCGGELKQTDKYTGDGTDWREYTCRKCGHTVDENRGPALWAILHEANERREAVRSFIPGDLVELKVALPDHDLKAGARGKVLKIGPAAGQVEVDFSAVGVKAMIDAACVELVGQA